MTKPSTFWVPVTFYVTAPTREDAERIVVDYLDRATRLLPTRDITDIDVEAENIREIPAPEWPD